MFVAECALKLYPTSLDQDNDLLNDDQTNNNLTHNIRNCIRFRKKEKEILQFLLELGQKVKKIMSYKFREKAFEDIELWEVEWEHIEKAHDYL
jgi:hypothetical protein